MNDFDNLNGLYNFNLLNHRNVFHNFDNFRVFLICDWNFASTDTSKSQMLSEKLRQPFLLLKELGVSGAADNSDGNK